METSLPKKRVIACGQFLYDEHAYPVLHAGSCSNFNALDAFGRMKGVAECGCRPDIVVENPSVGRRTQDSELPAASKGDEQ